MNSFPNAPAVRRSFQSVFFNVELKQARHFFVRYLRKVLIELANREKVFRRIQANKIVYFAPEAPASGSGSNGRCQDNPSRLQLPQRGDRSKGARPGCNPIVHKDDCFASKIQRWTAATVHALTAIQLLPLLRGNPFNLRSEIPTSSTKIGRASCRERVCHNV